MSMPGNDDPALRKKLLFSLDRQLVENKGDHSKLRNLENVPLMPIAPKYGMEATRLASLNRPTWLFADQHDYYESFKDHEKVSFAAFSVDEFFKIEKLCETVGKLWTVDGERRLSRLIKEEMIANASFVFNPILTATFRSKLKFLRRDVEIVPSLFKSCVSDFCRIVRQNGGAPRMISEKLKHLHEAKVSCAEQISYRVRLTQGQLGKIIDGNPMVRNSLHKTSARGVSFFLQANADGRDQQSALGQEFCSLCGVHDDKLQLVVEKIMQTKDVKQLQDFLARKGIKGHEEQEYVPLPAQSLQPIAAPAASVEAPPAVGSSPMPAPTQVPTREALRAISSNVRQQPTASAPETTAPVVSQLDDEPSQDDEGAAHLFAAELAPRSMPVPCQDGLQPTRARDLQDVVRICSTPSITPAATRPSDQRRGPQIMLQARASTNSSQVPDFQGDNKVIPPAYVIRHLSSPSPTRPGSSNRFSKVKTAKDLRREQDIGIKGEVFVWNKLKEILGDNLGLETWTSELRGEAKVGLRKWRPQDPHATYADFTVVDAANLLVEWLAAQDVDLSSSSTGLPQTFHIEVKTTTGPAKEPFHMSHLQKELCEDLRLRPDEMFLIFRVFDVDGRKNGLAVLEDPWLTDGLRVEALDYVVFCEDVLSESPLVNLDEDDEGEAVDAGLGKRKSDCTVA